MSIDDDDDTAPVSGPNSPGNSLSAYLAGTIGVEGFLPPRDAEAPLAAWAQDAAQIIASAGREGEEVGIDLCGEGVRASIAGSSVAAAVTVEARHGLLRARLEGLIEDVDGLLHWGQRRRGDGGVAAGGVEVTRSRSVKEALY